VKRHPISLVVLVLLGCSSEKGRGPAASPPEEPRTTQLRILATSDVHGWLDPWGKKGVRDGGLAELAEMLRADGAGCCARTGRDEMGWC
jgi:2',3'-cyclic-nucleotide 2'-phosphodiesterase (5'-nucleotidase family)